MRLTRYWTGRWHFRLSNYTGRVHVLLDYLVCWVSFGRYPHARRGLWAMYLLAFRAQDRWWPRWEEYGSWPS